MELIFIFFTALFIGFSGAVVPGPLLSVTVNESLRRGISAGPLLIVGHALLEIVIIAGLVYGLSQILESPLVVGILGVWGGVVLLWLGYGIIKESRDGTLQLEIDQNKKGYGLNIIFAGVVVSLSNPYFIIWWGSIGAGYVVMSLQYGLVGIIVFSLGHILADFSWYTLVSWLVVHGKKRVSARVYQGVTAACGVFLVGMAVFFLYSGFIFFLA